jgi:hypothetical protein
LEPLERRLALARREHVESHVETVENPVQVFGLLSNGYQSDPNERPLAATQSGTVHEP